MCPFLPNTTDCLPYTLGSTKLICKKTLLCYGQLLLHLLFVQTACDWCSWMSFPCLNLLQETNWQGINANLPTIVHQSMGLKILEACQHIILGSWHSTCHCAVCNCVFKQYHRGRALVLNVAASHSDYSQDNSNSDVLKSLLRPNWQ